MKAEIILIYRLEDQTPDHVELVDVTCGTELMNLAHVALRRTQNDPTLIPAAMVNFNSLEEK